MHPLLLGSSANNTTTFNTEIKRLEDAPTMIREFEQEFSSENPTKRKFVYDEEIYQDDEERKNDKRKI